MDYRLRIRSLRKERDLTLKDLAAHTGLSVSYLSDIERCEAQPSITTITTIATALDVTVVDLLTGIEKRELPDELPAALQQLIDDPEYGQELTHDWIVLLYAIQVDGKRPHSKRDYLSVYLYLHRILD